MSVQCPAEPCDFTGTLDAVEGHLGGVCDTDHTGIVVSDLRQSLHGGSEGGRKGLLVALGVVAVVVFVFYISRPEQAGSPTSEDDRR